MRNVSFAILRDDQEPFASLPATNRGLIGVPIMMALGSIRWNREKRLYAGVISSQDPPSGAPLGFDGLDPLAFVEIEGRRLQVVLDTGSQRTEGWARLAQEFPELLRGAKKDTEELSGLSGDASFESRVVPQLRWKIGAFPTVQRDAPIIVTDAPFMSRAYARLGINVIGRAGEVTIDFHAMQLTLR